MRKIVYILIIAVLAGLAYLWFVAGPSVLMGGPGKAAIVTATREALAGPPGATMPTDTATLRPRGLCSKALNGSFACAVDIVQGDSTETVITVMSKDASGKWTAQP